MSNSFPSNYPKIIDMRVSLLSLIIKLGHGNLYKKDQFLKSRKIKRAIIMTKPS